jgi:hypothetical protein
VKLLVLVSTLDLTARLSSTPHWWQLLKALSRAGTDVVAVPYYGPAVESLYWRTHPNPCEREGAIFAQLRAFKQRFFPAPRTPNGGGLSDRLVLALARAWVRPRWIACVLELFRQEAFDAVLVLNLPLNQFVGLPERIRERYPVPIWFYDGDLPSTLPEFAGPSTTFPFYDGADPGAYDGFFSNSEGGVQRLEALGARMVDVVHWAADPEVYQCLEREQDLDVFFHGYGEAFRFDALERMIYEPSRRHQNRRFALGGRGFDRAPRTVTHLGEVHFSRYAETCARARVNLVVTRSTHATTPGTSSARPFELGAMGVAAVSNPWVGIERWFEPGREILVVGDDDEVEAAYQELWTDEARRRALGRAMRARVVACHTYDHRAQQLLSRLADQRRR